MKELDRKWTNCVFDLKPTLLSVPVDPLSRISGRDANWPTLPPDLPTNWLPHSNLDGRKAAADKPSDFIRSLGEAESSVEF